MAIYATATIAFQSTQLQFRVAIYHVGLPMSGTKWEYLGILGATCARKSWHPGIWSYLELPGNTWIYGWWEILSPKDLWLPGDNWGLVGLPLVMEYPTTQG